jgi:general stress protein 26
MDLKQEIWSHLKHMQTVYLATSQAGKPFVRPVILIFDSDSFWIATGTEDKKTGQIRSNSRIEICMPILDDKRTGYIRGAGSAEIVKDESDRKMIFDKAKFIHNYWKTSTHPGFTLLKLDLTEMEYMRIGQSTTQTILL